MAIHWVTLTKIAGPLVARISQDILTWTPNGPPEGEEPASIGSDSDEVKDENSIKSLRRLPALLEVQAPRPPVIYFEKILDPWTTAPLLVVYNALRGRKGNLRLASSDGLDMLLIQPSCWSGFVEELLRIQTEQFPGGPKATEFEVLFGHIVHCAISWEPLLSAHGIRQAMVFFSRALDISLLDSELIEGCIPLPSWYAE